MKWIKNLFVPVAVFTACAGISSGDSISPSSFSATLAVGESVTINKTVTIDAGTGTSLVDVFFLADQTGSMGTAITNVKNAANTILTSVAGLGNVAFAVGGYNGELGDASFNMHQNLTTSTAAAQTGINAWFASGGGDGPEANLYGLHHAATDTNWRTGSERILVWFGDAPGHDPSPGGTTPSDGKKSEADTTSALLAAGVNVQAISVGFNQLDSSGQATRIANATGGDFYSGINTADIVDVITDAITAVIANYTTVGLDLSEVPAGVNVAITPSSHVGTFDRTISRNFDFDVTFTGVSAGTHAFNIYGTIDGGRVATEADVITVTGPGGGPPPGVPDSGASAALLLAALASLGVWRRRILRTN